ncbi:hypothetical protein [Acetobacterium sp.]|uniref:hypothetical protein n=1 Tax=Acetobacterium sp. TaxID=1872094 RepID=UPI0027267B61|nr:hypothetical protein [Acetobacterium sp.]MDO9491982.1 hypothetical protein [Acetobacterium sp.]
MKKNKWLIILALISASLILSGCGLLSELKKTVEEPKDKVYGAWYDPDTKTYLVINHDQSYTMGFGMNAVNSGGTCTIDNEHVVLSIEYAIADGKQEDVPALNKEDIVCTYSINLGDTLVLKTGDGTVLRFQASTTGENTLNSSNQMVLTGLWKNIKVDESIRFDDKGKVTWLSAESKKEGRYEVNEDQVILTIAEIKTIYTVKYQTATRIQLTNTAKSDDIQEYERMGE